MSAIAVGNRVMFRSTFAGTNVFSTNILAPSPLIGYVFAAAAGVSADVLWGNGKSTPGLFANVGATPNAIPVLKVQPSTSPSLPFGRVVRSTVNNQSSRFIGEVYATLLVQTVPNNDVGDGGYIEHIVVRTREGLFWIAPASDIAVVPGQ